MCFWGFHHNNKMTLFHIKDNVGIDRMQMCEAVNAHFKKGTYSSFFHSYMVTFKMKRFRRLDANRDSKIEFKTCNNLSEFENGLPFPVRCMHSTGFFVISMCVCAYMCGIDTKCKYTKAVYV